MSDPSEAPANNELRCHCPNGHKWREFLDLPMDMRIFSRLMAVAKAKCPTCGAKAFLGWKDAPSPTTEPVD